MSNDDYILEILYKKQLESPSCMIYAMITAFEYTHGLEGIRNEIWWDIYNSSFNYYSRINEKLQKITNEQR